MTNIITIASYSLKRSFSIILGWGIPLMLLGIITIPFYDLVAENEKQLRPVLDTLKPLLKSFVGGDEAAQDPAGHRAQLRGRQAPQGPQGLRGDRSADREPRHGVREGDPQRQAR